MKVYIGVPRSVHSTSNFTSDISGEKFKVVQFCSNYDLTSQKTDSIDLLDNIVVRKYLF